MRTKLTVIVVCFLAITMVYFLGAQGISMSSGKSTPKAFSGFKTEADIRVWAKTNFTTADVMSLTNGSRSIVIIKAFHGSGITRVDLYVYGFASDIKMWRPVCLWFTETSDVVIESRSNVDELIFRSKGGRTLFTLPTSQLMLDSTPQQGEQ